MKKENILTVRVAADIADVIKRIARKDDRTVAWVARKLIVEALEERGEIKTPVKRKK